MQEFSLPNEAIALGKPLNEFRTGAGWGGILGGLAMLGMGGFFAFALAVPTSSSRGSSSDTLVLGLIIGGICLAIALYLFWKAISNRGRRVIVAEGGLVLIKGEAAATYRWDDLVGITQAITRHYRNGVHTGTTYLYSVFTNTGQKLVFSNEYMGVEQLGNILQTEITRRALPVALQLYHSGQPVHFGPLVVSPEGLTAGKKTLAWGEIEGVQVENGFIKVKKQGGWFNWANVPAASILNLLVFLNLVDQIVGIRTQRR